MTNRGTDEATFHLIFWIVIAPGMLALAFVLMRELIGEGRVPGKARRDRRQRKARERLAAERAVQREIAKGMPRAVAVEHADCRLPTADCRLPGSGRRHSG